MKRIIHNNINLPYSLHDMRITAFDVSDNKITMRSDTGLVNTAPPYAQVDGYVEFYDVQWDFSYVYLLSRTGNMGKFEGEKWFLKDFIERFPQFGISIMDETFGYHVTKYSGFILGNGVHYECIVEIYHKGDRVFIEV